MVVVCVCVVHQCEEIAQGCCIVCRLQPVTPAALLDVFLALSPSRPAFYLAEPKNHIQPRPYSYLQVKVPRADNIEASSMFGRPSMWVQPSCHVLLVKCASIDLPPLLWYSFYRAFSLCTRDPMSCLEFVLIAKAGGSCP